ncbi:TolC family protein [Thermus thermamylovorans]|uniref:TolC family protein n=1 Tax=Thermus thermamylovorans TaxID=2509362 RepID=A0A4Q9B567_9DEIN|nr:TolC family protein [Thermus thermamylovorans]TBH20805.1 TolC family protein [Thermus thermamylovorans]
MKRLAIPLLLGLPALAQPALDFPGAWEVALGQNPGYRNALISRESAAAELRALEADPGTLVLPLTQARQALALAEVAVAQRRLSLLQEVLAAYAALLEAQEREGVLRAQRALAERNLAVVRARKEVGNATELDLVRAEAELRAVALALEGLAAQRLALKRTLEAALGAGLPPGVRLAPLPEPGPPGLSLEELALGLEERLPALVEARQAVALAELQVRLADNDYTPRLALERARAGLEAARGSWANLRAQALSGLEAAHAQAQAAWNGVQTAREGLANQERALAVARSAFAAGTVSRLELEREEVALLQARQALLEAHNAYWRALAALGVAAGRDLTGFLEVGR